MAELEASGGKGVPEYSEADFKPGGRFDDVGQEIDRLTAADFVSGGEGTSGNTPSPPLHPLAGEPVQQPAVPAATGMNDEEPALPPTSQPVVSAQAGSRPFTVELMPEAPESIAFRLQHQIAVPPGIGSLPAVEGGNVDQGTAPLGESFGGDTPPAPPPPATEAETGKPVPKSFRSNWQDSLGEGSQIGEGASSKVYRPFEYPDVVVKDFRSGHRREWVAECDALQRLQGTTHFPKLMGEYNGVNNDDYLVEEFIDGENILSRVLESRNPENQEPIAAWVISAMEALDEIHSHGLAVRDFKFSDWVWDRKNQRTVIVDLGNAVRPIGLDEMKQSEDIEHVLKAFVLAFCAHTGDIVVNKMDGGKDADLSWGNLKSPREASQILAGRPQFPTIQPILQLMENLYSGESSRLPTARMFIEPLKAYFKSINIYREPSPAPEPPEAEPVRVPEEAPVVPPTGKARGVDIAAASSSITEPARSKDRETALPEISFNQTRTDYGKREYILGGGASCNAYFTRVDAPGFDPHSWYVLKRPGGFGNAGEMRIQTKIIEHLMAKGVERAVKLAALPADERETFLLEEYVEGYTPPADTGDYLGQEVKKDELLHYQPSSEEMQERYKAIRLLVDREIHYLPPDGSRIPESDQERTLRARWSWGLLVALAEIHRAGVLITDAKSYDAILVLDKNIVKIIDFGNGEIEEIETRPGNVLVRDRRQKDIFLMFGMIMKKGFGLGNLPQRHELDGWLKMLSDRELDPVLRGVSEKIARANLNYDLVPFEDAATLMEELRPLFVRLGVEQAVTERLSEPTHLQGVQEEPEPAIEIAAPRPTPVEPRPPAEAVVEPAPVGLSDEERERLEANEYLEDLAKQIGQYQQETGGLGGLGEFILRNQEGANLTQEMDNFLRIALPEAVAQSNRRSDDPGVVKIFAFLNNAQRVIAIKEIQRLKGISPEDQNG